MRELGKINQRIKCLHIYDYRLKERSDQFDVRVNLWENKESEHIAHLINVLNCEFKEGRLKYGHISGIEIGDNAENTSYMKEHVHIAVCLYNYTNRGSIIKKLCQNAFGWYVEMRDKKKPIQGWIDYHSKRRSKKDNEPDFIQKWGDLPTCVAKRYRDETEESDECPRRKKQREQWKRRKYLVLNEMWDDLDFEFPGFQWTTQCKNMKLEVLKQKSSKYTKTLDVLNNYIIWGDTGIGKSSSIDFLYPNCYKFQKGTHFWDGYDRTNPDHGVVWIDEMSIETLKTITGKMDGGFDFLKELGDRYAIMVGAKNIPAMKIRPHTVIITMNEYPTSLLPERSWDVNCRALFRKFKIVHGHEWLALNNLRLKEDKKGVELIGDDGYESNTTVDLGTYAQSDSDEDIGV